MRTRRKKKARTSTQKNVYAEQKKKRRNNCPKECKFEKRFGRAASISHNGRAITWKTETVPSPLNSVVVTLVFSNWAEDSEGNKTLQIPNLTDAPAQRSR